MIVDVSRYFNKDSLRKIYNRPTRRDATGRVTANWIYVRYFGYLNNSAKYLIKGWSPIILTYCAFVNTFQTITRNKTSFLLNVLVVLIFPTSSVEKDLKSFSWTLIFLVHISFIRLFTTNYLTCSKRFRMDATLCSFSGYFYQLLWTFGNFEVISYCLHHF